MSKTGNLPLENLLWCELCPFPTAFFKANEIFRKIDKSQLAHGVEEYAINEFKIDIIDWTPETDHYVLDGGSLFYCLLRRKNVSYCVISLSYSEFTKKKHYGRAAVIIVVYESGLFYQG